MDTGVDPDDDYPILNRTRSAMSVIRLLPATGAGAARKS